MWKCISVQENTYLFAESETTDHVYIFKCIMLFKNKNNNILKVKLYFEMQCIIPEKINFRYVYKLSMKSAFSRIFSVV